MFLKIIREPRIIRKILRLIRTKNGRIYLFRYLSRRMVKNVSNSVETSHPMINCSFDESEKRTFRKPRKRYLASNQRKIGKFKKKSSPDSRELFFVDVVISTKLNSDCCQKLVRLLEKTDIVKNIIIVGNQVIGEDPKISYQDLKKVIITQYPNEFNFAKQSNIGAELGRANFLYFLNDDISAVNFDWLESSLLFCQQNFCIMGNLLLYPDFTIQHGGMYYNLDQQFEHISRGKQFGKYLEESDRKDYREVTAVTGASLLLAREIWTKLGGFDEQLSQQYQDVDLCLRGRESGLSVYVDNLHPLMHFESQTVKIDLNSYRVIKKRGDEHEYFLRRWGHYLLDPDEFHSEVSNELHN